MLSPQLVQTDWGSNKKNQEKEEPERIQEEKKSPFVHVVYGISLSLIFIVLCLNFQSQDGRERERERGKEYRYLK